MEKMSDEQVLDKIHQINLDMLLAFDQICQKHDITYFICAGVLLGALRHRDFIPWDNDVDVVMPRQEFFKLLPYLREELDPELYEVVMPEDYGDHYFDSVPRVNYKKADIKMDEKAVAYYGGRLNKIVLDIYFFDKMPDDFRAQLLVWRLEFLYGLLNSKRYRLEIENYHGLMKPVAHLLNGLGKLFSVEFLTKRVNRLAVKYDNDPRANTYRVTNDTIHSFSLSFPISYYTGKRLVPIGKYQFPAPVEAEKCMTIHYGDYMTLPPEEERIPHWGFTLITADNFIFYD